MLELLMDNPEARHRADDLIKDANRNQTFMADVRRCPASEVAVIRRFLGALVRGRCKTAAPGGWRSGGCRKARAQVWGGRTSRSTWTRNQGVVRGTLAACSRSPKRSYAFHKGHPVDGSTVVACLPSQVEDFVTEDGRSGR